MLDFVSPTPEANTGQRARSLAPVPKALLHLTLPQSAEAAIPVLPIW